VPARPALLLIENVGQFDPPARFLLRHGSGMTWLAPDAIWITTLDPNALQAAEERWSIDGKIDFAVPAASVRLAFVGANPNPVIEPFDRRNALVSFFKGNVHEDWWAAVPVWGGVRYRDLFPGVDLVFRAGGTPSGQALPWRLEPDEGVTLDAVRLRIEGPDSLSLHDGGLALDTAAGEIAVPFPAIDGVAPITGERASRARPETWQQEGPQTYLVDVPLASTPALAEPAVPSDAADLAYSSYMGGSEWDHGYGTAVDDAGAIYVAGRTPSADFPTVPGSWDTSLEGLDAFVTKLTPNGNGMDDLIYATFLGGGSFDYGNAIAVSDGRAYVTGETWSFTFPTTSGALDPSCGTDGACNGWNDAFLVKLGAGGTTLMYATYIGGSDEDTGSGIALDGGQAYLVGTTKSDDLPTTMGAYDRSCGSDGFCDRSGNIPLSDAFVVKVNPAGGGRGDLLYGTFLGGLDRDRGSDVAVESGHAFITGDTWSFDFPASGAYAGSSDAFAVHLDPGGNGPDDLVYGRLLGGGGWDSGQGISAYGTVAYVTGETRSSDFPVTTGSYRGGFNDAFLVQVEGEGAVAYAAYLGGSDRDCGRDLTAEEGGAIVLAGYTESSDFPVTAGAHDTSPGGGRDAFVARLDLGSAMPEHVTYATYLGGEADDEAYAVAVDSEGHAYLAGYTDSAGFPTTEGAYDRFLDGTSDVFLSKLLVARPRLDLAKLTNGLDADQPPGPYLSVNAPVNWQYVLTNTGDFWLNNLVVADDQGVTISCPGDTLAPGASMVCTAAGTAQAGQYVNLGMATADPAAGLEPVIASDPSHYFGVVPGIELEKHTHGQDADVVPGVYVVTGGQVEWTYRLTNTGNVTLTGITVTDDQDVTVTCVQTELGVDEGTTCTATGTATEGQYANLGTVTGSPPGGLPDVSAQDPSHYFGVSPSIAIQKHTHGLDADAAPGPSVLAGDVVNWTYHVTNTGNIALSGVTVRDDRGVSVTCPWTELAVDEPMTCTASALASAGPYTNTGTVTATSPAGPDVTAQDPSHYFGVDPHIAIEKRTNGQPADTPPGPYIEYEGDVDWTYAVTNTGNVTLTDVTVTDDQGVSVTCPGTRLGIGEGMTCTASGTAMAGQYTNVATATGTPPLGPDVGSSDASHYYGSLPGITLEKQTNGHDADTGTGPYLLAGQPVTWTYAVINTGNVPLTGVAVTDDRGFGASCPQTELAVDEGIICQATGTVAAGQYANLGSVTGTPPVGPSVEASDPSHYFGSNPGITLEKYTNGQDSDVAPGPTILVGEPITWTYLVSNSGNVPLSSIVVSDDQGVTVGCPATELAVAASMICTATGLAETGVQTNTGTATGTPPGDLAPVSVSDPSHYFGADPAIDLEKQTNGQNADAPTGPTVPVGMTVAWDYIVTNRGNVPLSNLSVVDDQGVTVSCPRDSLDVDEAVTCTATGVAVTGQYGNLGTATGTPPDGLADVSDSDPSHYLGVNPGVDLGKRTGGQDADTAPGPYLLVGEPVTWTYIVSNTGDVQLVNVAVVDDQGVGVSCPKSLLFVNGSMTCTATGTVTAGQHTNQATVTANPLGSEFVVTASDRSHYFGADLAISLQKHTEGVDADQAPGPLILAGAPVNWTYRVTNSSNVTLTQIVVSDDPPVLVTCPQTTLGAGEGITCSAGGTAVEGPYANLGTASGDPPLPLEAISATDPSHYYGVAPGVAMEKRTGGQDADTAPGPYIWAGDEVTWSYRVSNTGNITLTEVVVSDDQGVAVSCPQTELAAGGAMTCTATGTAVAGPYTNTATVSGLPLLGGEVTASDPSHYFGIEPAIQVAKHTNGEDADAAPGPTLIAGTPVTWTYTVTNSGNITLTGVTVSDDRLGAISCAHTELGVKATMVCTATATAAPGPYANLGTARGNPPVGPAVSGSDPSHYFGFSVEPAIAIEKYTQGLDADVEPGPYVPVGEPVIWDYYVVNAGNVTLTNVIVTDDMVAAVDCPATTLAVGADMTCTAGGVAAEGQYSNLAAVSGVAWGTGEIVSDSDPSHYYGSAPGIDLEKWTNGHDADLAPTGPYVKAGQPVTWTYLVANSGNVALTGVTVSDDQGVAVSCPRTGLAAGEAMTCTATGVATAGQYANTGTVTGTSPLDTGITASDPSHYYGATLALTLEKDTDGEDADTAPGPFIAAGQPVTWTYRITNASNVSLDGVTVTDSQGLDVSCPGTTLGPGAAMTCTATAPAAAGPYSNLGVVTATPPGGLPQLTASDPSHYYGSAPGIDLEKRTTGLDADTGPGPHIEVGQPVTWTYFATNTGNVTLTGVTASDDQGVAVSCPQDTLAPDESMVCTATGVAAAGPYTNTGAIRGTSPLGTGVVDSDPSHYYGATLALALEKDTNGHDADAPPGPYLPVGLPVSWSYRVTNESNVALSDVAVTDSQGLAVTCPQTTLDPGGSMTCSASGTAAPGQYANTGTVTGNPPGTLATLSASDPSHYFGFLPEPAIAIEKRTNGQDADLPPGPFILVGDPVQWVFVVSNAGNVALSGVTVGDDQGIEVDCPRNSLDVNESMTCTASDTAKVGPYANTATVTGTPPVGGDVVASDASHYYGSAPGVRLQKRTNGQDAGTAPGPYIRAGDEVIWSYAITNTGNVTLTAVTVVDDRGVTVTCPQDELAPGEQMECSATGVAWPGQYANLGSATATPPVGDGVTDTDPSHYYGIDPALTVVKYTNGQDADAPPGPYILKGLDVHWTYVVTNTGNVTLTGVTVSDDRGVTVSCPEATLVPGEAMTCEALGLANSGPYANVGTARGSAPAGHDAIASDPSHYTGFSLDPEIDIQKRTNGQDADWPPGPYVIPGQTVVWEYLVTNAGSDPLLGMTVVDSDPWVTVSCPGDSLDVGQDMLCTATGTATAGPYSNLATVSATGLTSEEIVTDTDTSHYFGSVPGIDLEKHTNGQDADTATGPYIEVGQPVTWTYLLTNTGNVPLSGVAVTDDQGVPVSCPRATLAAGDSMTCTASGTAEAGPYANLGTVTAIPPVGDTVSDSDPSHYYGASLALTLEKQTNGRDADQAPGPFVQVGQAVTWIYIVTNSSNVALDQVMVTDSQGVTLSCPGNTLAAAPAGSMVCTATAMAQAGQYANVGTVSASPPEGLRTLTASDASHYYGSAPAIDLEKLTNGYDADTPPGPYVEPGGAVTWTYLITNTGNVTLEDVVVEDDRELAVNCPTTTLPAGAAMTCLARGTADAAGYHNLGTVTARFGDRAVADSDTSHYYATYYLYVPLVLRSADR
jgi:hypothetical protein